MNKLTIPIEHDMAHLIIIYLKHFTENNSCVIDMDLLKKRISTILEFLKDKYQFE